jgi:hypothetical protein
MVVQTLPSAVWLLPCVLLACGGASKHSESGGDGAASGSGGSSGSTGSGASSGSGGSGNAAGSGASSGSGGMPALGCEFQGVQYEEGERVKQQCNWCTCTNGQFGCTTLYCTNRACTVDGVVYYEGDSVPSGDCNSCTCTFGGVVECTTIACGPSVCGDIESQYSTAVAEAKACNPALSIDQCTELIPVGLPCSCHTFTNPANTDAGATMRELERVYAQNECGADIECEPCINPSSAFCSPEGRCEHRWDPPPGAGGVPGDGGAGGGLAGEGAVAGAEG